MQPIKKTLLAATLIASISGTAHALPEYSLTNLGTLGGTNSSSVDINAAGYVIGGSRELGINYYQGFLYDGAMHNVGTLGTGTRPSTFVTGINSSGYVSGYSSLIDEQVHAFIYNGTTMQDLGTFGGYYSHAFGINDAGHVAGSSNFETNKATNHAFLYDGASMQDLGTLGGKSSVAKAINAADIVVGDSGISDQTTSHAFRYDGSMHDLGTLGGSSSTATAINAAGLIVGSAQLAGDNATHAFIYDGSMHDIGTLQSGGYSTAADINVWGQVVGESDGHAYLYDGLIMYDLNNLLGSQLGGWTLISANGINDVGQIAATGQNSAGITRAFLLSPIIAAVPIPTTAWLFGSSVLGLAGIARRKSKTA